MLGVGRPCPAGPDGRCGGASLPTMDAILVVADSRWVVNDVLAATSRPGRTVDVESDPRAAVDRLAGGHYDAAIVDLQVGSMGGMAVTRAIKDAVATGAAEPVHVVLLLDRSADRFLAGRAGADVKVLKPFVPQELRAALEPARSTRGA